MASTRNYREEYQRRIARAAARGLSRSQARGHPRVGEASIRVKPIRRDDKLEAALKAYRRFRNLSAASKEAGVSSERLRRFLKLPRITYVFTDGEARSITLANHEQASLNGRHQEAVGQFLRSNDIQFLLPFEGQSVIDTKGKAHPLETDPNALHQIASAGNEPFHEIYRIVQ